MSQPLQPPTLEDLRRAYEIIMWLRGPSVFQQLPPPPTPTQPGLTFPPPPPPARHRPGTIGSVFVTTTVPGTPVAATLPHRGSISSGDLLPDPSGLPDCIILEGSTLPTPPPVQSILPPPLPGPVAGPPMLLAPIHTHPKLFEHVVGKPFMFCVPIVLKNRGRIAEIFRVSFEPYRLCQSYHPPNLLTRTRQKKSCSSSRSTPFHRLRSARTHRQLPAICLCC